MPGIGTAVGGVLGALGDMFTSKGGSSSAAPGIAPSASPTTTAVYGSGLDASGWNVNFSGTQTPSYSGGSHEIAATQEASASASVPGSPGATYLMPQGSNGQGFALPQASAGIAGVPWWAVGLVAGVLLVRLAGKH